MKFDADIDLFEDIDPEPANRRKLQRALEGNANFLRIKEDSKHPVSSFAVGRRNRLKNIPQSGNYGIIPHRRLFILDFDCHHEGYSPINEQIDFFSYFLETDIRETLAVVTQSGGVHAYLMFPEEITEEDIQQLPKSLRRYSQAFSEISGIDVMLDADIRSGLVNGYVIGPGSAIQKKTSSLYDKYWIADETVGFQSDSLKVLAIPESAVMNLQEVVGWRVSAQSRDKASQIRKHIEITLEGVSGASTAPSETPLRAKPERNTLKLLKTSMDERDITSFHAARAFIKSALHCCYDDHSIAVTCIELGVDKDSYNGKSIGFRHLLADLKRFKPREHFHSRYCDQGKKNMKAFTTAMNERERFEGEFDHKIFAERIKLKIEKRSQTKGNASQVLPRVLNIGLISEKLLKNRKTSPPQQYLDAMNIVDYFLQPLSNVGVERILLARKAVRGRLQLSPSRAAQAMRLLRESGVIEIKDKQRTGMLPSYHVPEDFNDKTLTKLLRVNWGVLNRGLPREESESIFFDRFDGSFKKVFSGEQVDSVADLSPYMKRIQSSLPNVEYKTVGAGAALSYLKSEADRHEYDLVPVDGEIIDRNTGEIFS